MYFWEMNCAGSVISGSGSVASGSDAGSGSGSVVKDVFRSLLSSPRWRRLGNLALTAHFRDDDFVLLSMYTCVVC